jgi:hypothetical protein
MRGWGVMYLELSDCRFAKILYSNIRAECYQVAAIYVLLSHAPLTFLLSGNSFPFQSPSLPFLLCFSAFERGVLLGSGSSGTPETEHAQVSPAHTISCPRSHPIVAIHDGVSHAEFFVSRCIRLSRRTSLVRGPRLFGIGVAHRTESAPIAVRT